MLLTHGKVFNFCTLVLLASSCNQQPPGGSSPTLSKSRATPGEYLSIEHPEIATGAPIYVKFAAADGSVIRVESHDVTVGRVGVAVPPVYDAANATIGAGEFRVSLENLDGTATLNVDDLPALEGTEPGEILAVILQVAIETHQRTLTNLSTIQAQNPGANTSIAADDLNAQIQRLQATLEELSSTGQLVLNLDGLGQTTVTPDLLLLGDRLLVGMLIPSSTAEAGKRAPFQRDIRECLTTDPVPGFDRAACLYEVVSEVGTATLPWVETAGRVATGVGVVVTVVGATAGLVAASPVGAVVATGTAANIALYGLLTSVAGGTVSFVSAAMQGKNTDDFLQERGEDFNAGLEILSQMSRVLVSATATGFESLEDGFSTFTTWFDRFVTGMDAYAGFACSDGGTQKSIQPRAASIEFCTIVRPPEEPPLSGDGGCDDFCLFFGDGECDDGGPGSTNDLCNYGSDCTDCGPRDGTVQTPDLTPEATDGACCIASACYVATNESCLSSSGVYQGDATVCAPSSCTAPPSEYVVWYTGNVSC